MNSAIVAAIAYGILAIVGGIIGYLQAQSRMSLISGSISGLLLLAAAGLQLQGYTWGLPFAAGVTAILVVFFTRRLVKTKKFMPAGLMIALGTVTLIILLNSLRQPS